MPIFYRGAGIGTYWHRNDARLSGFTPHFPGANRSVARVMNHISRGTTQSAYVSLTLSYEVALTYAITWSTPAPTASNPAYVYEIDIPDPPTGVLVVDPVVEVAGSVLSPLKPNPYQHNGCPEVLLGLIDATYAHYLASPCKLPPGSSGRITPRISDELQTLVLALRDSEVLVAGVIPRACVSGRYDVY